MNRNWSNHKQISALKTKLGNNLNNKETKYNENTWPTELAAISQKAATKQVKPNQERNEKHKV